MGLITWDLIFNLNDEILKDLFYFALIVLFPLSIILLLFKPLIREHPEIYFCSLGIVILSIIAIVALIYMKVKKK